MRAPDRIDIARRALGQAFAHPYTWAPFAPIAGAYAFLGAPWWICLPVALAVGGGVSAAWMKRWQTMLERTRTDAMADYRREENEEFARRVAWLATPGAQKSQFVKALQEGLEIKRAIENRLFGDGSLTEEEEEVNRMAADLLRTMIDEAERMHAQLEAQFTAAASARFEKAAQTLRQANMEIETILNPLPANLLAAGQQDDAMSQASERLNERIEQAKGVRRILERTLSSPDETNITRADQKPQPLTEG